MKKVFIGGFLSLLGSIWALPMVLYAASHLVSSWSTPPGRLLATLSEYGLMPFVIVSMAFIVLGVGILLFEFFQKEN